MIELKDMNFHNCPVCGYGVVVVQKCRESVELVVDQLDGEITIVGGHVYETYDVEFIKIMCEHEGCGKMWNSKKAFLEAVEKKYEGDN